MNAQTKTHTATPWRLYNRRTRTTIVENDNYSNVLEGINCKANAAFIVKAVNNHDALVETLKSAKHDMDMRAVSIDNPTYKLALDALKAIESGS